MFATMGETLQPCPATHEFGAGDSGAVTETGTSATDAPALLAYRISSCETSGVGWAAS